MTDAIRSDTIYMTRYELEREVERLRAEVELHLNGERKLLARIEAALALHKADDYRHSGKAYCSECADPTEGECDTVKALKGGE